MVDLSSLAARVAAIAAVADLFPGVVIINRVPDGSVVYISARGLALLGVTAEEVYAMDGATYHARFFNPADDPDYKPRIMEMMTRNALGEMVTFFQQVRTREGAPWSWYSTSATVFYCDADGHPTHLLGVAVPIDPQLHVTPKVQRLLEEKIFRLKHAPQFAQLTARERDVLRLLVKGQSAHQIGAALNISVQTAETHRRNLRQKLGAASAYELGQFARAFDLV